METNSLTPAAGNFSPATEEALERVRVKREAATVKSAEAGLHSEILAATKVNMEKLRF
ncbi:hypothetical protein ACW9H6_16430 [Pseudomonas sp. SDO528_S397]